MKEIIDYSNIVISELNDTKSPRVEIILLDSFIEYLLIEMLKALIQSDVFRKDQRSKILNFLNDRGYLTDEMQSDILLFENIRGKFAHNLSLENARNELTSLFGNLKCLQSTLKSDAKYQSYSDSIEDKLRYVMVFYIKTLIGAYEKITMDITTKKTESNEKRDDLSKGLKL